MEVNQTSGVALFLRRAIEDVKKKNSGLSLRSVAKKIGISPSYLSKITNGQKALPPTLIENLTSALNLDHLSVNELKALVIAEMAGELLPPHSSEKPMSEALAAVTSRSSGMEKYQRLSSREYWLVEKWYYLAVFNLASTIDFQPQPQWIAQRLGITETQARDSLGLLLAGGYLDRKLCGSVKQSEQKLRFPTSKSDAKIRGFHIQHLQKAIKVLERATTDEDFSKRLVCGITFSGDIDKFETAKSMIHEAIYRAAEYLADGKCNDVFHLSLQLLPLTKEEPGSESTE